MGVKSLAAVLGAGGLVAALLIAPAEADPLSTHPAAAPGIHRATTRVALSAPPVPGPGQAPLGLLNLQPVAKPVPKPTSSAPPATGPAGRGGSRPASRSALASRGPAAAPAAVPARVHGTGLGGLVPHARSVLGGVLSAFPQITSVIGVRPDSIPDHPSGRAVDFMIPDWSRNAALGNDVVAHVQAHAGAWNVDYVIYRQRIWSPGSGWRAMSDRGSPTANHYDHVHVSVRG